MNAQPTIADLVRYEVEGSWWAGRVSWPWAQKLAGQHFARRVRRKLDRAARARLERALVGIPEIPR